MCKQILFIGLTCLNLTFWQSPAWAACTAVGNSCTSTNTNQRGNCCVGTCVTYSGQPTGPGFCGDDVCSGCRIVPIQTGPGWAVGMKVKQRRCVTATHAQNRQIIVVHLDIMGHQQMVRRDAHIVQGTKALVLLAPG